MPSTRPQSMASSPLVSVTAISEAVLHRGPGYLLLDVYVFAPCGFLDGSSTMDSLMTIFLSDKTFTACRGVPALYVRHRARSGCTPPGAQEQPTLQRD